MEERINVFRAVVYLINQLSSNFYNTKVWISICNYQKNLLLEQQYLFGQQKPLWTTEPTTSNTKLEEQPIEEINEYILTLTAFNLEID